MFQMSFKSSAIYIKLQKCHYYINFLNIMEQKLFFDDSDIKKYSKVSSALRCRLFRCIYINKKSIKSSAKLCNLNYSTAKSMIKNMSAKEEKFISNELNQHKKYLKTRKNSKIRIIKDSETIKDKDSSDCTLQQGMSIERNSNLLNRSPLSFKPVVIISSIGHDFFKIEDGKDASCFENLGQNIFLNPFQSRKSFTCQINLNPCFKNFSQIKCMSSVSIYPVHLKKINEQISQ